MRVPAIPDIKPLRQLSPSVYEALLRCKARGAWTVFGDKGASPPHPKSLLGICLHGVVEDAHNGRLGSSELEGRLAAARGIFDHRAAFLYEHTHPLLRIKFSSPDRLPYYNLYRERAAVEAVESAERANRVAAATVSPASTLYTEKKLVSNDGLLIGRPDFIDAAAQEITEYKTGVSDDGLVSTATASEVRQIRLYAHLAIENGIPVSRGVIARADGRRAVLEISREDAETEGRKARELLAVYNEMGGLPFDQAAQPSPENCNFCACIPFCESFWRTAAPEWAEDCGIHLEGRVSSVHDSVVQRMNLVTLQLDVRRGTVSTGDTFVEQIPEMWIRADGADTPHEHDTVRVVNGRLSSDQSPQVIRVDRASTTVWTAAPVGESVDA